MTKNQAIRNLKGIIKKLYVIGKELNLISTYTEIKKEDNEEREIMDMINDVEDKIDFEINNIEDIILKIVLIRKG